MATLLQEVCRLASTIHHITSAYHPQTNGLAERFNHTLVDMISMYLTDDQDNWDAILPYVTYAYNTSRQATTGFSPYYLLHAREPMSTIDTLLPYIDDTSLDTYLQGVLSHAEDVRQLSRIRTLQSQQQQIIRHAEHHPTVSYNVGDEVLVWTPSRQTGRCEKLEKRFKGPFRISRKLSSTNYEVTPVYPLHHHHSKSTDIVHIARLKPYYRQVP